MGARQIGKSTVVKQVLKDLDAPYRFYSADNVPATNSAWISNCWAAVRSLKESNGWDSVILVVDEIQKISNWSEVVKKRVGRRHVPRPRHQGAAFRKQPCPVGKGPVGIACRAVRADTHEPLELWGNERMLRILA